mmetsp:Transcript_39475/g.113495  ORF Transcript_39475/g.113495 Transcript_39475/m.113495 type:complete len:516 (+) Transcript_39475:47-1594(+)
MLAARGLGPRGAPSSKPLLQAAAQSEAPEDGPPSPPPLPPASAVARPAGARAQPPRGGGSQAQVHDPSAAAPPPTVQKKQREGDARAKAPESAERASSVPKRPRGDASQAEKVYGGMSPPPEPLKSMPPGFGHGAMQDGEVIKEPLWKRVVEDTWLELRRAGALTSPQVPAAPAVGRGIRSPARPAETLSSEKPSGGKSRGFLGWRRGSKDASAKKGDWDDGEETIGEWLGHSGGGEDVPTNFRDAVLFNARMVGANSSWIEIVADNFGAIVAAAACLNDAHLELEANLLALRIHKGAAGKVHLNEFKLCLLASLRCLLPGSWTSGREQAWQAMWQALEDKLKACMDLPARYEQPVAQLIGQMETGKKRAIGKKAFAKLFEEIPDTENYFKSSNERLIMIVSKSLQMAADLYQDPAATIDNVHSLALRHIMMSAPPQYSEPLVRCIVTEVARRTQDPTAVAGVAWALAQIAATMARAVDEGSTPLIQAVIANDPKKVRKALGEYARKDRAQAAAA